MTCAFPNCRFHAVNKGLCIKHQGYTVHRGTDVRVQTTEEAEKEAEAKMFAKLKKKEIPKVSKKRAAEMRVEKKTGTGRAATKASLDAWFMQVEKEHWGESDRCACSECGEQIPVAFARHATAHLFPKKLFPSVATHPLNYMILGAGCGCHEKTHRIDKIVTLHVWPEIARRMNEIMPELPFDELARISTDLHKALDQAVLPIV